MQFLDVQQALKDICSLQALKMYNFMTEECGERSHKYTYGCKYVSLVTVSLHETHTKSKGI